MGFDKHRNVLPEQNKFLTESCKQQKSDNSSLSMKYTRTQSKSEFIRVKVIFDKTKYTMVILKIAYLRLIS